jgi:class 3 adenylate cyclase
MSLLTDLNQEVSRTFSTHWTQRNGTAVPTDTSVSLGNDGVNIEATVLYADLADSTDMVDGYTPAFSAEIYKTFLHCSAKIIRSEGGEITAYDGDRIMAVFIGDTKNTSAVRAAMKINWAVKNIIEPALSRVYTTTSFKVRHVCGIDRSSLLVAKTGVRGANDLVWVGRAANYAAKLSSLPDSTCTYITQTVYDQMLDVAKITNGQNMWTYVTQTKVPIQVLGSTWHWSIS